MRAFCSRCEKWVQGPERLAGKTVRCPGCKGPITFGTQPSEEAAGPPKTRRGSVTEKSPAAQSGATQQPPARADATQTTSRTADAPAPLSTTNAAPPPLPSDPPRTSRVKEAVIDHALIVSDAITDNLPGWKAALGRAARRGLVIAREVLIEPARYYWRQWRRLPQHWWEMGHLGCAFQGREIRFPSSRFLETDSWEITLPSACVVCGHPSDREETTIRRNVIHARRLAQTLLGGAAAGLALGWWFGWKWIAVGILAGLWWGRHSRIEQQAVVRFRRCADHVDDMSWPELMLTTLGPDDRESRDSDVELDARQTVLVLRAGHARFRRLLEREESSAVEPTPSRRLPEPPWKRTEESPRPVPRSIPLAGDEPLPAASPAGRATQDDDFLLTLPMVDDDPSHERAFDAADSTNVRPLPSSESSPLKSPAAAAGTSSEASSLAALQSFVGAGFAGGAIEVGLPPLEQIPGLDHAETSPTADSAGGISEPASEEPIVGSKVGAAARVDSPREEPSPRSASGASRSAAPPARRVPPEKVRDEQVEIDRWQASDDGVGRQRLVAGARSDRVSFDRRCLRALCHRPDAADVAPELRAAVGTADLDDLPAIAETLLALGDDEGTRIVFDTAIGGDAPRAAILWAALRRLCPPAIAALILERGFDDPRTRIPALDVAGRWGPPETPSRIARFLTSASSPEVRRAAARALERLSHFAVPAHATGRPVDVWRGAAEAHPLRLDLEDLSPAPLATRPQPDRLALDAWFGDGGAATALALALDDDDETVRFLAAAALTNLGRLADGLRQPLIETGPSRVRQALEQARESHVARV